jgi:hypothetical protein
VVDAAHVVLDAITSAVAMGGEAEDIVSSVQTTLSSTANDTNGTTSNFLKLSSMLFAKEEEEANAISHAALAGASPQLLLLAAGAEVRVVEVAATHADKVAGVAEAAQEQADALAAAVSTGDVNATELADILLAQAKKSVITAGDNENGEDDFNDFPFLYAGAAAAAIRVAADGGALAETIANVTQANADALKAVHPGDADEVALAVDSAINSIIDTVPPIPSSEESVVPGEPAAAVGTGTGSGLGLEVVTAAQAESDAVRVALTNGASSMEIATAVEKGESQEAMDATTLNGGDVGIVMAALQDETDALTTIAAGDGTAEGMDVVAMAELEAVTVASDLSDDNFDNRVIQAANAADAEADALSAAVQTGTDASKLADVLVVVEKETEGGLAPADTAMADAISSASATAIKVAASAGASSEGVAQAVGMNANSIAQAAAQGSDSPHVTQIIARSINLIMKAANSTGTPTLTPTLSPTSAPSKTPTLIPSSVPSMVPTLVPTISPTATPTTPPSMKPTLLPTQHPTTLPTHGSCTDGVPSPDIGETGEWLYESCPAARAAACSRAPRLCPHAPQLAPPCLLPHCLTLPHLLLSAHISAFEPKRKTWIVVAISVIRVSKARGAWPIPTAPVANAPKTVPALQKRLRPPYSQQQVFVPSERL